MGKDVVSLNLDANKYLKDSTLVVEEAKKDSYSVFVSDEIVEKNPLELQQELVTELEQKLAETRDKYENGNGQKAFTGGVIGLFVTTNMLGSKTGKKIAISIAKMARKVKNPRLHALFTIGSVATTLTVPFALTIPSVMVLGKLNDKNLCISLEEKLASEKAKLASLQQAMFAK